MIDLISEIKRTVVFLGEQQPDGESRFNATGFLLDIKNLVHLATAKHAVVDPETGEQLDEKLSVFFNSKAGGIATRPLSVVKERFEVDWLFHEDDEVDIAIIPFGLDVSTDDVKTIPDNLFISTDRLFELYDVFFLSYQPGIRMVEQISPLIRQGIISLITEDRTFYIDGAAFPGNSGSPVFLRPSPIRFDTKGISIGGDKLGGKFIGIVGEYLPYREVAVSLQTGRPRVMFEENTGLSKVWPTDFITAIIESQAFQSQLARLTGNGDKPVAV